MPKLETLSEYDRDDARSSLKDALYHMTCCCDALSNLENILGVTVEGSDIDSMAAGLGSPDTAYQIEEPELDEWLDQIVEENAEDAEPETETAP